MSEAERRERYERFAKTELGRIYIEHKDALYSLWVNEQSESSELKKLKKKAKETGKALLDKLMELAGV
jgi:hypothetical protein